MAHYKLAPGSITQADKDSLIDVIKTRIFPGAEAATEILIMNPSGFIDPITEEITYANSHIWLSVSGIVGSVTYQDRLLQQDARTENQIGRIVVGGLKVSYEHRKVADVQYNNILNVRLTSLGVAGLYHVAGYTVDEFGGTPLFLDLALVPDRNDYQSVPGISEVQPSFDPDNPTEGPLSIPAIP